MDTDGEDLADQIGYRIEPVIAGRYKVLWHSDRWALPHCSCKAIDLKNSLKVHLDIVLQHDRSALAYRQEFAALRQLDHLLLVKAHNYIEDDKKLILATEWIDGEPLSDSLLRWSPSFEERLNILHELATALAVAHGRDVAHQSLKPTYIFLRHCRPDAADCRIKVRGFDSVVQRRAGDAIGSVEEFLSEIRYSAPECFKPSLRALSSADIYSFGVIAFELFTGRLPFDCDVPHELMNMQQDVPIPPVSNFTELPGWVDGLIAACTAKNPRDRISADEIVTFIKSQGHFNPVGRRHRLFDRLFRVVGEQFGRSDTRGVLKRSARHQPTAIRGGR